MDLNHELLYSEKVEKQKSFNIDNFAFILSLFFIIFLATLIFYDVLIERLDPNNEIDFKIFAYILIFLVTFLMFRIKYLIIYPSYPIKLFKNELEFPTLWIERVYKQMRIPYSEIEKVKIKNEGLIKDIEYSSITITTKKRNKYYSGLKPKKEIDTILQILQEKNITVPQHPE